MELIYTDEDYRRIGVKRSFALDLSFGVDGNDFELTLATNESMPMLGLVYVDGTEWGGRVESDGVDTTGDVPVNKYYGRTWHGILATHIVMPTGDYYTMTGEAHQAIKSLIAYIGLADIFTVPPDKSDFTLNYQVARFSDAYTALRNALKSVGARLKIERKNGETRLSAVAITNAVEDGKGSSKYTAKRSTRPTNHLVCAGEGELSERVVVHLYADEDGNISQTQSLFGIDEVAELYDYTSADSTKLVEDGTKKLQEILSGKDTCSLSSPTERNLYVGDVVGFINRETGFGITSEVTNITVSITETGVPDISYDIGDPLPVKLTK